MKLSSKMFECFQTMGQTHFEQMDFASSLLTLERMIRSAPKFCVLVVAWSQYHRTGLKQKCYLFRTSTVVSFQGRALGHETASAVLTSLL